MSSRMMTTLTRLTGLIFSHCRKTHALRPSGPLDRRDKHCRTKCYRSLLSSPRDLRRRDHDFSQDAVVAERHQPRLDVTQHRFCSVAERRGR